MEAKALAQIAARLRKLELRRREDKTEMDGLRSMLDDAFNEAGVEEVRAGRYLIRRRSYTRQQFDTKAFREQQPVAYDLYCKPMTVSKIEVVG